MKVLFVAYYFDPFPGVGARRISYWARHLHTQHPSIRCDVITATDPAGMTFPAIDHVHHVPDSGKTTWAFQKRLQGYSWRRDLARFIRSRPAAYDACVLTGGPFMPFGVAPMIRRRYGCRILLDFRDPFANNPVHPMAGWKRSLLRRLEKRYIRNADAVIVVNRHCRELLCERRVPVYVIENGYDETVLDPLRARLPRGEELRLVYAGKLLAHRDAGPFLEVIQRPSFRGRVSFTHIGDPHPAVLAGQENSGTIHSAGPMEYAGALRCMQACDVGVIFTRGEPFESTSKIFDYLGLEKPVLIITGGEPQTGELHDITREYPAVTWCRNRPDDIAGALETLRAARRPVEYPGREQHARRNGLAQLVDALRECTEKEPGTRAGSR